MEKTNARSQVSPGIFDLTGNVQVNGFEIGMAGRITPKWQILAGYTYLDAEIVSASALDRTQGKTPLNTPEHSATVWSTGSSEARGRAASVRSVSTCLVAWWLLSTRAWNLLSCHDPMKMQKGMASSTKTLMPHQRDVSRNRYTPSTVRGCRGALGPGGRPEGSPDVGNAPAGTWSKLSTG